MDHFIPGGGGVIQETDEENDQNSNKNRNRIIRVFNRNGQLSCSSEEIKGLSHVLNVRPIGNLVASSQRFGAGKKIVSGKKRVTEGPKEEEEFDWGKGRAGRHDIIFFERNGLRHGEFSLREEENEKDSINNTSSSKRQINHEIKELKWNSDGNALGIWIKRFYNDDTEKDFVQVWTTMNYHWYL